nr:uncharacterized protein [Tanacetum cinerariifolium]
VQSTRKAKNEPRKRHSPLQIEKILDHNASRIYILHTWLSIKEQRLKWTRNNQDTLQVDLYHNLCDGVTRGEMSAVGLVVYVIEFQKRGLPHAYIILWLEEHSKCKTFGKVDDIISAEIPSLTADPDGYKVVTDYMMHGPCGKDARNAACTSDRKYSKHFPKPFLAETFLNEDGYPHYRRRDNKVTFKNGNFIYDNKYVVPHNRYLLLKYMAHINVEWCNISKAIKYLFKYLNKGPDRATIVIEENVKNGTTVGTINVLEVDEIKNYLNCKFLAPCEVVWWLFLFDIYYTYPSIMQLSFHLPNQNAITLRDSERLSALQQREGIDVTMFTDWGVFGFEELMTINKRVCPTFKEACFGYGLLHDDKEWSHAIVEASLWALGPQLRDIFVTMLIFCNVSRPLKLWEESWQTLSKDILAKMYFKDLPQPDPKLLTNMDNRLIREALDFAIKTELRPCSFQLAELLTVDLLIRLNCIKQDTQLAELMQEVQLIIWDEAPMARRYDFEALDTTLRDILGFTDSEIDVRYLRA